MSDRVSDDVINERFEEFITAHQTLVYVEKEMANTENRRRWAFLRNLKRKAEDIIKEFNASDSRQQIAEEPVNDTNPHRRGGSHLDEEDDEDDVNVILHN